MMDTIIGHGAIARELRQLVERGDAPHAVLFAGPEGVGRSRLALEYAMLLNCEGGDRAAPSLLPPEPTSRPCGTCRPCRLISQGAHPDVVEVGPGDTLCRPRPGESSHPAHPLSRDIRICQVRGVVDLASRFPNEARQRLILIDPADRMNRDAANALLKTLEEPPGQTVFALISGAPEMLPETIVSRCRRIDVGLVARVEIEAGLTARGVDPAAAAEAAEASHGRPGRAIAIAAKPEQIGDRMRILERCGHVAAGSLTERLSQAQDLAERWRRDRAATGVELDLWESFWESDLSRSAQANDHNGVRSAMAALGAVAQARADLLAQVTPRTTFELMLLTFPRTTLRGSGEDRTLQHAVDAT